MSTITLEPTLRTPANDVPSVNAELPPLAEVTTDQQLIPGDLLGHGGMGEVRRVLDARLGRQLALKVSTASDPAAQARFVREARVQGQLEHPGIVPVHELGLDPKGAPFFTMKRVRGLTLSEVLAALQEGDVAVGERFPRRRLLAALQSLAQTLDFAHSCGVIHRDVKPSNVMLGDFGEVYLLDWGIAKVGTNPTEGPQRVAPHDAGGTLAGAVMGTPGYLSPEQAAGQPVTTKTDVWSLGTVLFEVLTGTPLIRAPDTLSALAATHGPHPSPRARAPQVEIAPELDALCSDALHLVAEARPTARQFGQRLETILAGERDSALRDEWADRHVGRAHEAAQRSRSSHSLDDRREALREVGRALALQPENAKAHALFTSLLAEAPVTPPPEVAEEMRELARASTVRSARNAIVGYGVMGAMLPTAALFADMRVDVLVVMGVTWFFAMAMTVLARLGRLSTAHTVASLIAVSLMNAANSCIAGPLLVVPGLAAANTMAFMMWVDPKLRPLVFGGGLFSVIAPFALSALGWWPTAYAATPGGLRINSVLFDLSSSWAVPFLTIAPVLTVIISGFASARVRDELTEAQQRTVEQRWAFAQLRAPTAARGSQGRPASARSSGRPNG